jgi:hypothetical protein
LTVLVSRIAASAAKPVASRKARSSARPRPSRRLPRIADERQEGQHRGNADHFEQGRDPEPETEQRQPPPVAPSHHPQEIEEGPHTVTGRERGSGPRETTGNPPRRRNRIAPRT